ncbi:xaa-Pro aminopeptidase ApepP-like isoform X2 [Spodoptera litura]|uniref:Xaa-Pro aminopeptidase ApepP-like isoform X2 n=1 Tax=Spodoptera litura TaxID=69820 RepID=A0A9J7ERE4_SPOLT|nr:xaa-Pro aminopeptidase ApepP-like isoform X2 [Spodoptera litura]
MLLKCVLPIFTIANAVVWSRSAAHGDSKHNKLNKEPQKMSVQRLSALRAIMSSQPRPLAAYIIPTCDAHNSEYIAPVDARREWISGFTGSAGTAVVTPSAALLWTDGRYYTQFEQEADMSLWTLMKQSLPETPTMEKWLVSNLTEGAAVGVDPYTFSRDEWNPLQSALTKHNMVLVAVGANLVDEARKHCGEHIPCRPSNDIIALPLKFTGKCAGEKIAELRAKMEDKKASALVITALDEVAYVLNLRGSDIEYNPVFFSYLIITPTAVLLFTANELTAALCLQLAEEHVHLQRFPYDSIEEHLRDMAKELSETGCKHSIWLSSDSSEAIHRAASGADVLANPLNIISEVSPVSLMKLTKNDVELQGFRDCHVRDGIAVVRLLKWLHDEVDGGKEVTEIQAADKLLEFRKDEEHFMGPSFSTIPGSGANGAIIHYCPSRDGPQKTIEKEDMFILDSGGQYMDGTTDITRTRHLSRAPTSEQKSAFTRVLQGQIMVGAALFPQGVKGNVLDSFARHALWEAGLDYAHGTGHGVGHFLNVHEGPCGVSWRPYPHDPGLKPGQVLSNEPGYYKVGSFGIRHEDLVETINVTKETEHPRAAGLQGDFDGRGVLGFRTLTLVPHQRECIDASMMSDFQLQYINNYHKRVFDTLGPILKERRLHEEYTWLQGECAPMIRA